MKYTCTSLLIIQILFSCRPTTVLQSGPTQYKAEGEINKVLVIAYPGILKNRAIFEDAGVSAFSSGKREVLSLHNLVGTQDSLLKVDPEKMRNYLVSNQIDAVVEVRFVSIRQEQTSSDEQYPTRREYRIMDDTHYSKYIQEYEKRDERGAIFDDMKVKMDVRLLRKVDEKYQVVWSARTECSNPKNNSSIAKGCTKKAVSAMKKQEVL